MATYPNKKVGITSGDIEEIFKNRLTKQSIQKRIKDISSNRNKLDNQLFLVAKDNRLVIGVCKVTKNEEKNQLQKIYVLPNYQGQGIGKMLWKNALKFFDNNKDIVVHVVTYNTKAIKFYKKLGFIDSGKRFNGKKCLKAKNFSLF